MCPATQTSANNMDNFCLGQILFTLVKLVFFSFVLKLACKRVRSGLLHGAAKYRNCKKGYNFWNML